MKILIDTVAIDIFLCLIFVILFDLFLDERRLFTIQILILLKEVPHDFFFVRSLCHLPEPHHAETVEQVQTGEASEQIDDRTKDEPQNDLVEVHWC